MSDVEAFALFREGALFGLLGGVLLKIAGDEAIAEFKRWRSELRNDRARVETERERMLRAATKQVHKDAAMIERMRREREARR